MDFNMELNELITTDIHAIVQYINNNKNDNYKKSLGVYCLYVHMTRFVEQEEKNLKKIIMKLSNILSELFCGTPMIEFISGTFNLFCRGFLSNYPYLKRTGILVIKEIFQSKMYDDYITIHCKYCNNPTSIGSIEKMFRIDLLASICAFGRKDLFDKIHVKNKCHYPIDYLFTRICASGDITFIKHFHNIYPGIFMSQDNKDRLLDVLEKCGNYDIAKYIFDEKKLVTLTDNEMEKMLVEIVIWDNVEMLKYFDKKKDIHYKFKYKSTHDHMNQIHFLKDDKGYYYFTLKNLAKSRYSEKCICYFEDLTANIYVLL